MALRGVLEVSERHGEACVPHQLLDARQVASLRPALSLRSVSHLLARAALPGYVWLDMPGKARHIPEHELEFWSESGGDAQ